MENEELSFNCDRCDKLTPVGPGMCLECVNEFESKASVRDLFDWLPLGTFGSRPCPLCGCALISKSNRALPLETDPIGGDAWLSCPNQACEFHNVVIVIADQWDGDFTPDDDRGDLDFVPMSTLLTESRSPE